MNSYFQQISGLIKYIAVIDRDNSPILFLNLTDEEKELDFQLLCYSSLDLLEYKESKLRLKADQRQLKNAKEEYLGLLMPFYEYEYDIGVYGFVGNNGVKIVTIKKLESTIQETSSELKLKQVSTLLTQICKETHSKFIKLLLNPFYDKKEFYQEESQLRENFANNLISLVKQHQII